MTAIPTRSDEEYVSAFFAVPNARTFDVARFVASTPPPPPVATGTCTSCGRSLDAAWDSEVPVHASGDCTLSEFCAWCDAHVVDGDGGHCSGHCAHDAKVDRLLRCAE